MPNLLKNQYLDVKRRLLECASELEKMSERDRYYHEIAESMKTTVKGFSDGLTGMLDNCYRYYKANNKGRELMAEAAKAATTAKGYYRNMEILDRDPDFAKLHNGSYAHAKTEMMGIITALEDYRDHGMTVHHNFFT